MMDSAPLLLVVDDSDTFRDGVSRSLENYGFRVAGARSAPAALELASRTKVAACLMDIALPGVDGIQLLRYFRSRHTFRYLPVVVLTESIDKQLLATLVKLNVKNVFLKSSYSFDALVAKLLEFMPVDSPFGSNFGAVTRDSSVSGASIHNAESGGEPGSDNSVHPLDGLPDFPKPLNRSSIDSLASLRVMPCAVEELIEVAANPSSSLENLESSLKKDPVLAARIIKAANSAAFLRGGPVNRIEDSLRVLGFGNVVRIAIAGGVISRDDFRKSQGGDLLALWRSALCSAMVGEKLAARPDAAKSYAQNLMCGLPLIFLIQHLAERWKIWKDWAVHSKLDLDQLVQKATGIGLGELAREVFRALQVPVELSHPIIAYYDQVLTRSSAEPGPIANRMDIVHQISGILGRTGCVFQKFRSLSAKEISAEDLARVANIEFQQDVDLIESSLGMMELAGMDAAPPCFGELAMWREPEWHRQDPLVAFLESRANLSHYEDLQELLRCSHLKVVLATPGTTAWNLATARQDVLILRAPSPSGDSSGGSMAIHLPVELYQLEEKILGLLPSSR